jgi:primosomal protein N' (replication factor Y)
MRVLVQFGKTRYYAALVLKLAHSFEGKYSLKPIEEILDTTPILDVTHLSFWQWMAQYYLCSTGEIMSAAMPSGLCLSSETVYALHPDFKGETTDMGDREHLVSEALRQGKTLSTRDVEALTGLKSAMPLMRRLIEKKIAISAEDLRYRYRPKLRTFIIPGKVFTSEKEINATLAALDKAPRQYELLLKWLQASDWQSPESFKPVARDALCNGDASARAALSELLKKQYLLAEDHEEFRVQLASAPDARLALSEIQQKAIQEIEIGWVTHKPVLLHGVTGSGKTEIYLQLIAQTIQQGKQVLYLIPEIALTTQLVLRLRKFFGEDLGIYHSRFGENERVEVWQRVRWEGKGRINIVAGARSAVFLPFANLGLVIIDEEHDSSYKQSDPAPRFHARDAALQLASMHGAQVILGTATPSFESYFNCLNNKYQLVVLPERYGDSPAPLLQVCDLARARFTKSMKTCLSPELFAACNEALEHGEQIILFQNRRGFAPVLQCHNCGYVHQCPRCDISLTWHKGPQLLTCHYCGHSEQIEDTCRRCGHGKLTLLGKGTERIEEDVELLFPGARIARLDLDSTRSRKAYAQVIQDFAAGRSDFLIGTQMVTKGLDFARVGVVGIIDADRMLRFPDFRSFERAWQMMTQVAGRAGRRKKQGRVFIQTTEPCHTVIASVVKGNYTAFYQEQMLHRQRFFYPPFSRLVRLEIRHPNEEHAHNMAAFLAQWLTPHFGAKMLGPEKPPIARLRNYYIRQILLKLDKKELNGLKVKILNALRHLESQAKDRHLRIVVDVDPL